MISIRTSMMALALAAMTIVGASGTANAGPHNGSMMGNGFYHNMTPEAQAGMQKAYAEINPMEQQLYAKKVELDARIAAGADEQAIQGLVAEVNALSAKLTEAQARVKRQMIKDGVPYSNFMQYCMMKGGMGHGGMGQGGMGQGGMGQGGMGHGGMGHGGMGQGGMGQGGMGQGGMGQGGGGCCR